MNASLGLKELQDAAIIAAHKAGAVIKANLQKPKRTNKISRHDIKLELDVRCQGIIQTSLNRRFPDIAILGEEGVAGDPNAEFRWVVDPIDGTVNFTYGIPHACVSIALQKKDPSARDAYDDGYSTLVGVVFDPFCGELWTGIKGHPARLNGKPIRVSKRDALARAVVSIGLSKSATNISRMMPYVLHLARRVLKIRVMGSASLALVYVAGGRFDAYVERGLHLWDIAAGGFIVECAGGEFWRQPLRGSYAYRVTCTNGKLRQALHVPA